jgi:hypothetical protein
MNNGGLMNINGRQYNQRKEDRGQYQARFYNEKMPMKMTNNEMA